jgi:hypothetical protein
VSPARRQVRPEFTVRLDVFALCAALQLLLSFPEVET